MSPTAMDAVDVAILAGGALEAAGIRYFLGGSLASSMQGEPRSTNGIDLVVEMAVSQVAAFAKALGPDFSVDDVALAGSIARGQSANIFYLPLFMKIDLIPLGPNPYDDAEFSRRRQIVARGDGARLWVKSPEDSVLRKLWWFVQGGSTSERQWRDVVAVLRVSGPRLDAAYLDLWSKRLGLEELLERARGEAKAG